MWNGGRAGRGREHRVAGQPRVHQQNRAFNFETKAGMAKPDDLHVVPLWCNASLDQGGGLSKCATLRHRGGAGKRAE